jgi:hypothetical protein
MIAQVSPLGKPDQYKQFIKNQFPRREVLLATVALAGGDELPADVTDAPGAVQNRPGCCGTITPRAQAAPAAVWSTPTKSLSSPAAASTRAACIPTCCAAMVSTKSSEQ